MKKKSKPIKLIIAGSRHLKDEILFELIIQKLGLDDFDISEIVSGAAQGIDTLGEHYALQSNREVKRFPADWDKYGNGAGVIRNREMMEYADAALVIHENSPGSLNMIATMKKAGKPLIEVFVEDSEYGDAYFLKLTIFFGKTKGFFYGKEETETDSPKQKRPKKSAHIS